MTLHNIEQPGVSRVRIEKKEKKEVENVPADRSTRATRVNAASRIGLRSGLNYDLCFGRTANVRFIRIKRSDVRRTSNPPRANNNEGTSSRTIRRRRRRRRTRNSTRAREKVSKRGHKVKRKVAPLTLPIISAPNRSIHLTIHRF